MADELAAVQHKLLRSEQELAAARSENLNLRTSQMMLEAELRRTEHSAHTQLNAAQQSLRESYVNAGAVSRELRHEEHMRQTLVANHRRNQASAQAEAAAEVAAVTAEIGLFEIAAGAEQARYRQQALAADTERALMAEALGATERSLAVASARVVRATRAAESAAAAGFTQPATAAGSRANGEATGAPPSAARQTRNDGLTPDEAATGPSGAQS